MERKVVKCTSCELTQFVTVSGNCRKCQSLLPSPIHVAPATPEVVEPAILKVSDYEALKSRVSLTLRVSRASRNISQRELGILLKTSRTYVSKIERGHSLPTLDTITRFSHALNITPFFFMTMVECCE